MKPDSALRLALDKNSVRSFDQDGRMQVKIANISKANICPYKGAEIPGWEDLGLEADRLYEMFRDPRELEAAAPTFNGVQLLRVHKPVDANDHQMWDIVGTTGSEAAFDGTYLTNSLFVWTKEGIALIESGDQCELSCGYHYVPDMTPGNFGGKHFDGVMRNIKGNHVALVEEGRAGPDVVVGDSALKPEGKDTMKPTRLEYAVLMRTAAAINPLLALDAKVNYLPVTKGLNSKNFRDRKPKIIEGVKKLIAGKTIAKDASIEHLASMLDHFETAGALADGSADAEVGEPQMQAMQTAGEGVSPMSAPLEEPAAMGKKFGDSLRAWAKDAGKEFTDEEYSALDAMHSSCSGASDEEPKEDDDADGKKAEDGEMDDDTGAADGEAEETEEERKEREAAAAKKDKAKDKAKDAKTAKDKGTAMDRNVITQDTMNQAIAAERKRNQDALEARTFVRPMVGELPMALDTAEGIYRAAAELLHVEGSKDVHASALKPMIKMAHDTALATRAARETSGGLPFFRNGPDLATDSASADAFSKMFPGAQRIGNI